MQGYSQASFSFGDPHISVGFVSGSDSNESALQCSRAGFDPWVGKVPRRREREPTPVFLPGEFHGQRSLKGLSPRGRKE